MENEIPSKCHPVLPWVTLHPKKVTHSGDPGSGVRQANRVGRYALMKRIGQGGMAEVWIGKMSGGRNFEKVVAIKLLPQDNLAHPAFQRSLGDEAHILMSLRHPNVVEVLDFNFEEESPYLVMEFIEGVELRIILKYLHETKQTMPVEIASFITTELANGLIHSHERSDRKSGNPLSIVHRDVSPSNILITRQGESKLTDFGIAKSALQSDRTQVGQIKGKFRYMSPEQARGEDIDLRCDVFSLGLVFYECLFGGPAYDDPSETKIYDMARTGQVTIPESIDADLRGILKRLLAVDRRERYGSLRYFLEELNAYLGSRGKNCDRGLLKKYLDRLSLTEFAQATALREEVERWSPLLSPQVVDRDKNVVTLNYRSQSKTRPRRILFGVGSVAVLLVVGMLLRIPRVRTEDHLPSAPKVAPVSMVAPPVPAPKVVATPQSPPPLVQKKKTSKVIFDAEPFAEVSVAGLFRSLETPTEKTLPEGTYSVFFVHPPTGRKTTVRLKIDDSGRIYVCRGLMEISSESEPSARCWTR